MAQQPFAQQQQQQVMEMMNANAAGLAQGSKQAGFASSGMQDPAAGQNNGQIIASHVAPTAVCVCNIDCVLFLLYDTMQGSM